MILPTVGETNIGMAWDGFSKFRTAPPHRSQGFVLHLGPHGRWAEVPTLQLLTEQVQNLVSWAKSKILFLPQVPGGRSGQFFPGLRGICF